MAYITAEELQLELEGLAQELGISVSEALAIVTGRIDGNVTAIEALQTATATNAAAIEAITEMSENGVESLAEKVKALNDMFTENGDLATDVLNRIAANTTAIGANVTEINALKVSRDNILASISTLDTKVNDNKTVTDAAIASLDARVVANKTASETRDANLQAGIDGLTATTIADKAELVQSIADEKARALAVENANLAKIDAEIVRATTKEDSLQAQLNAVTGGETGSISELAGRVTGVENRLNDTVDVEGNLVKGIDTKISDNATSIVTEATRAAAEEARIEAKVDALQGSGLVTGVICGRKAANKFRIALGQAEKVFDCGTAPAGDGEAL